MARGRRGDPPAVQQAKGNPGRRKSKVEKAIDAAERLARSLESVAMEPGDSLPPPEFLTDARLAPALRIWREVGPELKRTNRLAGHHQLMFAMFCIYTAEWLDACRDIVENGKFQSVTTTVGGKMERTRPIVAFREIAYRNAIDLGHHFGLTPREEYALFRDQSDALARNPGLFGRAAPNTQQPDEHREGAESAAPSNGSVVGLLDSFDSAPPPSRH